MVEDKSFIERIDYTMRSPCRQCAATGRAQMGGFISRRSGQDCVYCAECGGFQYNAPRHERGLAPIPVRSNGVSPSVRYFVQDRAKRRCEFCGRGPTEDGIVFHVGHLVSQENCRSSEIPLAFSDHVQNLVWLCDSCNLGQGEQSLVLHDLLVILVKRALAAGPLS